MGFIEKQLRMSANKKRSDNLFSTSLSVNDVPAKIVGWANDFNSAYDASHWEQTRRNFLQRDPSDLQIAVALSRQHYFVTVTPRAVRVSYGKPADEVDVMATPPRGALKSSMRYWSAAATFPNGSQGGQTVVKIDLSRFFYGGKTGEMGGRSEFDHFINAMSQVLA